MSTDVTLSIKGDVEVLRLQPGDVIVVTLTEHVNRDEAARVKELAAERFPNHEIVVVANGLRLAVQRDEVPA